MPKSLLLSFCLLLLVLNLQAKVYTHAEAVAAWEAMRHQPVTEKTFRETCDLMQDIGQTDIQYSYHILADYLQAIRHTGNRKWVHILLMGWAKAKESFNDFEEADSLYNHARKNAQATTGLLYNESLAATTLLYSEWGKKDSLEKYAALGEKSCRENGDRENLSFIYTFKAFAHVEDTAAMRQCLDSGIRLAAGLPNKNALFTAQYNHAVIYSQFDLRQQVKELEALLELAKDSTLSHKPKLYERTAFCFRNPTPSIYYQLMQVSLLLADYDHAWKFAELFYDATVKPNPNGAQAPYFNAVLAMVKAYQGEYDTASAYLRKSKTLFNIPEDSISYTAYHLAAGLIAEHQKQPSAALHYFQLAYRKGSLSYGLHVMPAEIYYAHELVLNGSLDEASRILAQLQPVLQTRMYSAVGFYYYREYAELLKAKGDYAGYAKALERFYAVKDSLTNINHYRAVQEIEARVRLHDKEQQITRLNEQNEAAENDIKRKRMYLVVFSALAAVIIILLFGYARNQLLRKRQALQISRQQEVLQQQQILELEKQHRIDVMQGTIDAEEKERHKIADQLHDEVGAMLALASLHVSSTIEKGSQHIQADEKLQKAHEILTGVSSTVRLLSHQLTPLMIEKYGFRKAIEDMAYSVNLSGRVKLETLIVGFEDIGKYPIPFQNNLYRIIQELTHNILKHAHATHALIELVEHDKHISMMVEDDGIGIDETAAAAGKGLVGIRSKIAYLNGEMEVMKKNDKGTLIVIEINV